MNNASRLLRSTGSFGGGGGSSSGGGGGSSSLLAASGPAPCPLPPLGPAAVPRALEEELEAQARASLALFGFGVRAVTWSPVAAPSAADGPPAAGLRLMDRVAPLGAHSLLWRAAAAEGAGPSSSSASSASSVSVSVSASASASSSASAASPTPSAEDEDGDWDAAAGVDAGAYQPLQQYLVKSVAVLPSAALEDVVELLVRSDGADMDLAMQQLVGARVSGSGFVYRRRKKKSGAARTQTQMPDDVRTQPQQPRKRQPLASRRPQPPAARRAGAGPATVLAAKLARRRAAAADGAAADVDEDGTTADEDESSGSDSDSDEDEDDSDDPAVLVQDDLAALNVGLPRSVSAAGPTTGPTTGPAARRPSHRRLTRQQSVDAVRSSSSQSQSHAHSWSSLPSPPMVPAAAQSPGAYADGYRRAMARSGHQGRLSIKWAVGDKPSRMFGARATYCLLDYECALVNDWDDAGEGDGDGSSSSSSSPMFVRVLRSCYLPQCQPWLDELGGRPRNVQPVGIMVRQRPTSVEVQVVASILEKPQQPAAARRAKLRALCARLGRVDELLTGRRLSHSLLTTQPLWVHDRERPGCRACGARFGLSRRRHHCRICGEICCAECCPKVDLALPEVGSTSVRVCVSCRHSQRRKSSEAPPPRTTAAASSAAAGYPSSAKVRTPPSPGEPLRRTTSTGSATTPGREAQARSGQRPPPPPPSTPTMLTPPVVTTPPQQRHAAGAASLSPAGEHYLASLSSYGPPSGLSSGGLGERKPSIASNVLHKLKSGGL